MKLLFVAHASSYSESTESPLLSLAPWVEALIAAVSEQNGIELSVLFQCQMAERDSFLIDKVRYFPLSLKLSTQFKKWHYKFFNNIHIPDSQQRYKKVIGVINPDVICVFGSEFAFLEMANFTNRPLILHIQSLVNPYLKVWYSTGINMAIAKAKADKLRYLKGAGVLHAYKRFEKMAQREQELLKQIKFVMGRTEWDKTAVGRLAPQARYFHVDEIMRPVFYNKTFTINTVASKLLTAVNPNVYKGLDLVFETAAALELNSSGIAEWRIAGVEPSDEVVTMAKTAARATPKKLKIIFLGPLSAEALVNEMLGADIYVHASAIENSSNSICEAMLVGMPVVVLNTGGTASLVEDGIDGLLLNERSAHAMAEKIADLANSAEIRLRLSAAAKAAASIRHNPAKIVENIVNVFSTCSQQHAK